MGQNRGRRQRPAVRGSAIMNATDETGGPIRLMVCAGEVSGDLYAAALVRELRKICAPRPVEVFGIGGDALAAEGASLRAHVSRTGVIGLWEVAKRARFFSALLRDLRGDLAARRPDALLTVDYPGLNLRLARSAKELGVTAVHWVCPQVWAWHRGRIPKIAAALDCLVALFPFEPALFEGTGLDVRFAGHPLIDQLAEFSRAPREPLPWGEGVKVALFAGSRTSEVRRLLPRVLAGAALARKRLGRCSFVLPAPDAFRAAEIGAGIAAAGFGQDAFRVVEGRSRQVLAEADLAIVKSGTSTLEAALLGCPHTIIYRVSTPSYMVLKRLVTGVSHIGLPNIVAGRTVCTELIQDAVTPERICEEIVSLASDKARRERALAAFGEIRRALGGEGATGRTARIVAEALSGKPAGEGK